MKLNQKYKIIFGVVLFVLSVFSFTASFLFVFFKFDVWAIVVMFIISSFLLFLCLYVFSKAGINKPIAKEKPITKSKRVKHKKQKRPFITEKEWKKEDEEDDDMFFIEKHVDDD